MKDMICKYKNAAIEYGIAQKNGDHKKANKAHNVLSNIYNKLKIDEKNTILWLTPLTNDKNQFVVLWASTHLLKLDTEFALTKLEYLSQETDLAGFIAKTTISLWKNKELDL